jgi:hypothetical protein
MKPTVSNKSKANQGQRSRNVDSDAMSNEGQNGKENKAVGSRGKGKTQRKTRAAAKKHYCVCKKPDDGTPMVNCSECKDW